jgi:hypothetical protein
MFYKTIKELRPSANLPLKVAMTNVHEWRTPEDRDEKTGSSCIKIPELDRGDDDLKMTQMKGAKCKIEGGQVQNVKMSCGEKNGP